MTDKMGISLLEKELNTLNENQLKAVVHHGKPLFVVAGAGTGKTKTLTTKIAYLIEVLNADPNSILAVTFTNKAAKEIKSRINSMIYPKQMGSWLYTFHAFSLRVLRDYASYLNLGYRNDFDVIDDDDSLSLVRDAINLLKLDTKEYAPRALRNIISQYKLLMKYDLTENELKIYDTYQNLLVNNNLMDFDDLLCNTHLLFKEHSDVLNVFKNRFKYVLVDEFQDTDKIQYDIIKMINSENTFVVGDPDQSIYSFRGARYENNNLFLEDFNASEIILDDNYRSTNNILKLANNLITYNDRKSLKELKSDLGLGKEVLINELDSDYNEVDYILRQIMLKVNTGYNYTDIAVLYRNNAMSRLFEHAFRANDIPYVIYGGISFYERKEVKDILAYLKLAVSDNNNFFFKRIVNVPSRKIGKVTLEKLEEESFNKNKSLMESIDSISTISNVTKNRLIDFRKVIYEIREEINKLENIASVIDLIFKMSNYEEELAKDTEDKRIERKENIDELKSVFITGDYKYEGNNIYKIKQVLDELALFSDTEIKKISDGVKLSTVHQVKGLEFEVVFIVAVEEGLFPNFRVSFDNARKEEERRLFYVAITRAKKELYITHTKRRLLYGEHKYNTPSSFLSEIKNKKGDKTIEKAKQKIFTNETNYNLTDKIMHNVFGKGIIVRIDKDVLEIAFNHEHGIKKIKANHHSIKRID